MNIYKENDLYASYSDEDLKREIRALKRIICARSVQGAYMDDGEASYCGNFDLNLRSFDFLRSNSQEILDFLVEYNKHMV
jgi:hypothetical protein